MAKLPVNKAKERFRSQKIAEHSAERYSTYARGVAPKSELKIRKGPGLSAVRKKVKALGGKLGRAAGAQISRAGTANAGKRTDNVNAMQGRSPYALPNVSKVKPAPHKRAAGVQAKVSADKLKDRAGHARKVTEHGATREVDYSPGGELGRRVGRRIFDVSTHAKRTKSLTADQARAESFIKRLAKK